MLVVMLGIGLWIYQKKLTSSVQDLGLIYDFIFGKLYYLAKKKAAIKIQSTFRGWRTRKELAKNLLVKTEGEKNGSVKNTGLVPQCLHLLQKTQRLIQRPEVQDLVSKKTKVDIRSATASVDNAKGAVIALCHRKFQISAYLATMAVGHAINATFKLFVPPGVGELERATRYSLG